MDDRACDRVHEQIEAQVCGAGILGEFQLLLVERVYHHEVPMHAVTGGRGRTHVAADAGVIAQG